MYLNIRPVRYSARIESVANARRQQLRTARQLRTAQSPKERDARLQQLRPAREQTIAPESTEERQTRLQQLETNPSSTAKKCSATEDHSGHVRFARSMLCICLVVLIASEASFLVCSMARISIYIYIYICLYISGRTSCRKCSKCFYVYLNIRQVRYSARIESVDKPVFNS